MQTRTLATTLLVLALALAGCAGGKGGKKDGVASDDDLRALPQLHGYVVDPAIRPLEGVTVKVLDTNSTTTTDDGGYFGLDDLPTEQFLVIVASKPGFIPQSTQVTLAPDTPVRLNFSLAPEPTKAAFERTLQFEGFIGCQMATNSPTGNNSFNCGQTAGNPGTAEKAR